MTETLIPINSQGRQHIPSFNSDPDTKMAKVFTETSSSSSSITQDMMIQYRLFEANVLRSCDFNKAINIPDDNSPCAMIQHMKGTFSNMDNVKDLLTHCFNETMANLLKLTKVLKNIIEEREMAIRHNMFDILSRMIYNATVSKMGIQLDANVNQQIIEIVSQLGSNATNSTLQDFFISSSGGNTIIGDKQNDCSAAGNLDIAESRYQSSDLEANNQPLASRNQPSASGNSFAQALRNRLDLPALTGAQDLGMTVASKSRSNDTNNYSNINGQIVPVKQGTQFQRSTSNIQLNNLEKLTWATRRLNGQQCCTTLANPWGVTFCSADRRIYIADRCNNRIVVCQLDGKQVRTFGCEGTANGEFSRPSAVAYDQYLDRLIVVDKDNHRVQVFTRRDLNFLFSFGHQGSGSGQFHYPWDCTVDRASNIYITDTKNCRIQVFNKHGEYVTKIFGLNGKKLSSPRGIKFCSDTDSLLVTDFELHKLVIIGLSIERKRVVTRNIIFCNSLFLKRPQAVDYCNGIAAIANSRSYEIKLFDIHSEQVVTLPQAKTNGIYTAGVCFGGSVKNLFATDIADNFVYKFEI